MTCELSHSHTLSRYTGETGLGKSTLINTLFRAKISRTAATPGPHSIPPTTEVMSVSHGMWTHNTSSIYSTDTLLYGVYASMGQ